MPKTSETPPREVYFFATCLVDMLYPMAGLSAMQLMQEEGVRVIFPKNQGCCGQPAFNSGYRDEALIVARTLLQCFPRNIPIVVPSGSCAGMLKHHWPELFAGQMDEAAALNVASRTYELTEFLINHLDINLTDAGQPIKIAIHTSCSARREMKVAEHIESLVAQLKNVEVLEQERKAECCGFGGTFSIKQPDISGAMVKDKADSLVTTGAEKVVSQDCGCLMNIGTYLEKQYQQTQTENLPTQHIAEFLWERVHAAD